MSVRIITKKSYEFSAMEKSGEIKRIKTEPFIVATVPEWVTSHDLFKLAQKSGNAEIVGDTSKDISISEIEELQEKAKEYGIKNYKNMKLDTLRVRVAEIEATMSGDDANNKGNDGEITSETNGQEDL